MTKYRVSDMGGGEEIITADGADIKHIKHAMTFLRPGGRLVALCANGPRQNAQLMPLVEEHGGTWEVLPEGSFKSQGTGVNVAMLSLTLNESKPQPEAVATAGQGSLFNGR